MMKDVKGPMMGIDAALEANHMKEIRDRGKSRGFVRMERKPWQGL